MRDNRIKQPPAPKTPEQALASLMRTCARAEKSSGDAMRLMARWRVEPQERQAILMQLIKDKFIDDRRFAGAYIREKTNLSGWGARKIAVELSRKGVARNIIEELLSELDADSMSEKLEAKLKRKMPTIKHQSEYELKSKLIRYGVTLGYDYEKVYDIASKLIKTDIEEWDD